MWKGPGRLLPLFCFAASGRLAQLGERLVRNPFFWPKQTQDLGALSLKNQSLSGSTVRQRPPMSAEVHSKPTQKLTHLRFDVLKHDAESPKPPQGTWNGG